MTPEGKVKKKLKDYLISLGSNCWWFMPIMNGYGRSGIPDFIICIKGNFIAVETKARQTDKAKAHQGRELADINTAGGFPWIVNDDESLHRFQYWIKDVFGV